MSSATGMVLEVVAGRGSEQMGSPFHTKAAIVAIAVVPWGCSAGPIDGQYNASQPAADYMPSPVEMGSAGASMGAPPPPTAEPGMPESPPPPATPEQPVTQPVPMPDLPPEQPPPAVDDPPGDLPEIVMSVDFEGRTPGPYSRAMAIEDFGGDNQQARVLDDRAEIVLDEDSGNNALKVRYPRGCVGPSACAMQLRTVLDISMEQASIRYRMKFDENFEFVKGGKLPGLCGGDCNTGCDSVSGRDGWSARMMWRNDGELVQYMYYPGKRSSCGDDYSWEVDAPRGQWIEVQTLIKLNTPGEQDGVLRAWFDGVEVLNREDFRYRDVADLMIDRFYFSTFYGGSSSDWAPSRDTFIYYDDFVITTGDPSAPPPAE